MPELPTGSLTFLFTDIEGSTRLWEEQHTAMREALARHDALLRSAIEGHRGHVFKTGGDGFCAAFPDAAAAVQAAVAAQEALRKQVPQLRVRMALHTGEAELREGDYFGPALSRVKRLQDAGHGGQVLLSRAAVAATRSALPEGTSLRPLGTHRLRGFSDSEAISQLLIPGLPSRFPPLGTLDVAFRRGVRRAALIAGIVIAVLGALALTALDLARREAQQRRVAEERQRRSLRSRLRAPCSALRVKAPLTFTRSAEPGAPSPVLRGFAWRYLHAACRGDERFTLTGHTDTVNAVAITSDGRLLASGGEDQSVRLWDLASRQSVALLPRGDAVTAVAFSPDGRFLAAGAGSGPVELWNVTTLRSTVWRSPRTAARWPPRGPTGPFDWYENDLPPLPPSPRGKGGSAPPSPVGEGAATGAGGRPAPGSPFPRGEGGRGGRRFSSVGGSPQGDGRLV